MKKNWLKGVREIDTTVTTPDGGDTKVLGIGEVEVLAKDVKGFTKPFDTEKRSLCARIQNYLDICMKYHRQRTQSNP